MKHFLTKTLYALLLLLVSFTLGSSLVYADPDDEVVNQDPASQDQLLQTVVNWDRSATTVVDSDPDSNSGHLYYQFKSNGLVTRSKAETVNLTLTETSSNTAINVCSFGPEAGLWFSISYPSCATGSQDVVPTINGGLGFFPGTQYTVTLTDASGLVTNHSADGDGAYLLPQVPVPSLPQDIVSVQHEVISLPPGTEGEYYNLTIRFNQTRPGETLTFKLRHLESGVFVEDFIATAPIDGSTINLPIAPPTEGLEPGSYELVTEYQGANFRIFQLSNRIGDSTGNTGGTGDTGGGVTGGIFSSTQQDILDNGLVSDCGYDINTQSKPDGSGRICGIADAVILIQRIIEYIFLLILPIAAIIFVYVGYLYITSGGNANKRGAARKAMTNLLLGILIIMAAWLLVRSVLVSIGVEDDIAGMFLDLNS